MASLQIIHAGDVVEACNNFYEAHWDLARGGVLTLLRETQSGTTILDARSGGPLPDLLVSISERLEDDPREVRLSTLGVAEVEVFQTADSTAARLVFRTRGEEILI